MQFVSMVQTFDGKLHEDSRAARRHLDKIYADKLCAIGRQLANQPYSKVNEFIDGNIDKFTELRQIKHDMVINNPEDGRE